MSFFRLRLRSFLALFGMVRTYDIANENVATEREQYLQRFPRRTIPAAATLQRLVHRT